MVVQKYGGTSVATTEKIEKIAMYLQKRLQTEKKMVVVLSAMSGETDGLSALGKSVASKPNLRELDQLVSIGENKTISLLGLALGRLGVRAISLTGWQAGIVTSTKFAHAQIEEIKIFHLKKYLEQNDVVIVAGFQGVTKFGDITTLGKGGSDTTAVALAASLGWVCEVFTDVNGVFSADPKILPDAKKLDFLSYDELMEMSAAGAKVMETRSVEIAKKYNVKLFVAQSLQDARRGTMIGEESAFEKLIVKNITAKDDVLGVEIKNLPQKKMMTMLECFQKFSQKLQMFSLRQNKNCLDLSFAVDKEQKDVFLEAISKTNCKVFTLTNLCKITLVGSGFRTHTDVLQDVLVVLEKEKIACQNLMVSEVSISFLVDQDKKLCVIKALSKQFELEIKKINLAIVGATGIVGKTFVHVLEQSDLKTKVENLYLFASDKSQGKKIKFLNKDIEVLALTKENVQKHKIDFAFFSAGEDVAKSFAKIFMENGAVVIDNSSAFRMQKDVPLIVPEVNFVQTKSRLIANPNCSTIQAMLPLYALKKSFGLRRVDFCTYQAVSGSGEAGILDLEATSNGLEPKCYPYPIFGNCLPHIGSFGDNGFSSEEMKMVNETHKILDDEQIEVSATCVRVPVEMCHSVAVVARLEKEVDIKEVLKAFEAQEGVVVCDDLSQNKYPINSLAREENQVFVGRIRQDIFDKTVLHFWCVADNVRKGAALNGVQILQKLLQEK